jgi:carbonic anhydrase
MPRKELRRILAGFRRFRQKYFEGDDPLYNKLQNGQNPKTLIIACVDSRVDPAILSDASPGELLVVRNVSNLVPPYEEKEGLHGVSSALEFGVVNLNVEYVVVLGHRQCGGIRALMTDMQNPGSRFLSGWVGIAEEAKQNVLKAHPGADLDTLCAECELEAIRTSLKNLRTFPFVQKAIEERGMHLFGAYFDLEEGRLLELNDNGEFTPIEI